MPPPAKYLSAAEAATMLGVDRASLYAYVSRGRIRAEPDPGDPRVSRYLADDVEQLRSRKEARRRPDLAARRTLAWGAPVLSSGISLIRDGRLYYRGQDATALAVRWTFEEVVRLLWEAGEARTTPRRHRQTDVVTALAAVRDLAPALRLSAILPFVADRDRHALNTERGAVIACGERILAALTAAAIASGDHRGTMATRLAHGWRRDDPPVHCAIDLALVLCADHELNASTFAVRVVASTGASPYDAVGAGLAALRGVRHGGDTDRVEALLDEARTPARLAEAVRAELRCGATAPGFHHPLYPDGDPRAALMLEMLTRAWPRSTAAAFARAATSPEVENLIGRPNLDCGLVLLRRAARLPRGAALILFALGRTAGWIAHAIEQYETRQLIRPRALYDGITPA